MKIFQPFYYTDCDNSCSIQILRDIILPDIKLLEKFENIEKLDILTLKDTFLWLGSYPALYGAIAAANELPKKCANKTGIDIKCSIEPSSKFPLESLALIAIEMMIKGINKYTFMF